MNAENLPVLMVAGLFLGIALLFILWKIPELFIAVLLCGTDFIQLFFGIFGIHFTRVTFAVTGGIVFGMVLLVLGSAKLVGGVSSYVPRSRQHLMVILLVFAVTVVLSIGLSYTRAPSYGTRKWVELLMFGVGPFALSFLMLRDLNSVKRLMMWTVLLTAFYIAFLTMYSLATFGTLFVQARFGSGNVFMGIELQGGAVLDHYINYYLAGALGWIAFTRNKKVRLVLLLTVPVVMAYSVGSGARTAAVSLAMFAFLAPLLFFKRRAMPALAVSMMIIAFAVGLFLVLPENVTSRFRAPLTGSEGVGISGQSRIDYWRHCLVMISESPFVGFGTGSFPFHMYNVDQILFPHNMFLEIWAENGILALIILIVLWYYAIRQPYRIWKRHRRGELVFGISVFMLLLLITQFGDGMLHYGLAHGASCFLLALGIITRGTFLVEKEERFPHVAPASGYVPAAGVVIPPGIQPVQR